MDISKDQAWKKHVVCLKIIILYLYFRMFLIHYLTKVNGRYIKLVDGKMDMGLSENRKWTYSAISSSHGDNNGIIRYII